MYSWGFRPAFVSRLGFSAEETLRIANLVYVSSGFGAEDRTVIDQFMTCYTSNLRVGWSTTNY